jgi:hypothetical protein
VAGTAVAGGLWGGNGWGEKVQGGKAVAVTGRFVAGMAVELFVPFAGGFGVLDFGAAEADDVAGLEEEAEAA